MLYVRSYLLGRTVVGVLGVLLPLALVVGEAFAVPGPVQVAAIGGVSGLRFGPVTALYVGEVAALWAFGASWLLAGRDLWLRLVVRRRGRGGLRRVARAG